MHKGALHVIQLLYLHLQRLTDIMRLFQGLKPR